MVTVTERAGEALEQMLVIHKAQPGQGLRLVAGGPGRIGLAIDRPQEGDEVIKHDGEPLLVMDRRLAESLIGSEIDCETVMVAGQSRTEFKLRPAA